MRAVALLALLSASAHATEDDGPGPARLAGLASTCAACHGTAGRAPPGSSIPGLASRPASVLGQEMREFRSGARAGTIMPQLARGYTDEQIDRLAAWFARQPSAPTP